MDAEDEHYYNSYLLECTTTLCFVCKACLQKQLYRFDYFIACLKASA